MNLKQGGSKMKKLLLVSLPCTLAVVISIPAMTRADIHAGMSRPSIICEAQPEIIMMPDTSGMLVIADADTDTPKGAPTGRDEKQQGQPLEKGKTSQSEEESDWKVNVWPVEPADNVKSLPEMKDEFKRTPPDRY